jgi:hypothetical protein
MLEWIKARCLVQAQRRPRSGSNLAALGANLANSPRDADFFAALPIYFSLAPALAGAGAIMGRCQAGIHLAFARKKAGPNAPKRQSKNKRKS